jgi:single-strand DNA-binding protein
MNKCAILGRLTDTPAIRPYGTEGKALASFTLAVPEGKDKPPSYFDCTAWGNAVEPLRYAAKGSEVVVMGKLKQETWDDKATGQKRSKVSIQVFSAQVFDKPKTPEIPGLREQYR